MPEIFSVEHDVRKANEPPEIRRSADLIIDFFISPQGFNFIGQEYPSVSLF
jgi:hypothetical protein